MKTTLLVLILVLPLIGFSQKGPGGVGTVDGNSSLTLWLDANTVNGSPNTVVTTWQDQSGNGYDFTGGAGAIFNTSIVNGYPAFNFNGTSQYFEKSYTADLAPDDFTIFATNNIKSSGTYKAVISNRDDPAGSLTNGYILYGTPNSNNWQFWTGTTNYWDFLGTTVSTVNNWSSQVMDFKMSSGEKNIYIDGTKTDTNLGGRAKNPNRPCRIGAGKNETSPDYFFKGDISEIIIYNQVINTAEKIIINNYLSAKYNYTLTADDVYKADDSANGNFDHDVAGIGQIDAANKHETAQGTGLVKIQNPTDLDDGEFLFWGHNNGVVQAIEITDVPSTVDARMERVWRVSEVNTSSTATDVGAIDISFDLSELGSVTVSDLRLLVDVNNDGIFSDEQPISGAVDLGGNIYQFSGVTAIENNLRFTIGTADAVQTTLPVSLVFFKAEALENGVHLNWQTASEKNNDHFVVERSIDGTRWEAFQQIDGAGNSASSIDYKAIDFNPYDGTSFYRLKQVDSDGQDNYSIVESVNTKNKFSINIEISPNPVVDVFSIQGDSEELNLILVYNSFGQNMNKNINIEKLNEQKVLLNFSKLSTGLYYVKTRTRSYNVYKK